MSESGNKTNRICGLDGLRAIAIIAVILYHMFPFTIKGGFLGVSLFFVLSGFLLSVSAESLRKKRKFSISGFYKKRLIRIYPALVVCIFVTTGFFFLLSPVSIKGIGGEILSILTGVNNWWQILQNSSYFTKIANASPFTHLWYLSLQLQFYLIWPFLFFMYLVFSRVASKKKAFSNRGFLIFGVLTLISALLMAILYTPGSDATRVYYGTDTRAYALLFGVMLGMIYTNPKIMERVSAATRAIAPIVVVVLGVIVLLAFVFIDGQATITYWGGMQFITFAFGIILLLVSDPGLSIGKFLDIPPLKWIGERSYEMYLWMYPVIFLFNIKKWTRLPFSGLIQFVIIIILAAWLHKLTGWIVSRKLSFSGGEVVMKTKKALFLAATLVFAVTFVIGGCASLTSGKKNSDADQVAKELEENAKKLEEEKDKDQDVQEEQPDETEQSADEQEGEEEPAVEEPEVDPLESVTCIGDSVMLGAAPAIEELLPESGVVDAKESRQVVQGKAIMEELAAAGKLGDTVVIALGTNSPFNSSKGQEIIDYLGADRKVFWVNVYGANLQWEDQSNAAIQTVVDNNDNVTLIDWNTPAGQNPDWFYNDGIHLKPDGQKAYAQIIIDAITAAAGN